MDTEDKPEGENDVKITATVSHVYQYQCQQLQNEQLPLCHQGPQYKIKNRRPSTGKNNHNYKYICPKCHKTFFPHYTRFFNHVNRCGGSGKLNPPKSLITQFPIHAQTDAKIQEKKVEVMKKLKNVVPKIVECPLKCSKTYHPYANKCYTAQKMCMQPFNATAEHESLLNKQLVGQKNCLDSSKSKINKKEISEIVQMPKLKSLNMETPNKNPGPMFPAPTIRTTSVKTNVKKVEVVKNVAPKTMKCPKCSKTYKPYARKYYIAHLKICLRPFRKMPEYQSLLLFLECSESKTNDAEIGQTKIVDPLALENENSDCAETIDIADRNVEIPKFSEEQDMKVDIEGPFLQQAWSASGILTASPSKLKIEPSTSNAENCWKGDANPNAFEIKTEIKNEFPSSADEDLLKEEKKSEDVNFILPAEIKTEVLNDLDTINLLEINNELDPDLAKDVDKLECLECPAQFADIESLEIHIRLDHNEHKVPDVVVCVSESSSSDDSEFDEAFRRTLRKRTCPYCKQIFLQEGIFGHSRRVLVQHKKVCRKKYNTKSQRAMN